MLKLFVLIAALACVLAAPSPDYLVGGPALVARLADAPKAPASTAHAAHVAAPIVPLTYAAPFAYAAPYYPIAYRPIEAHGYRYGY